MRTFVVLLIAGLMIAVLVVRRGSSRQAQTPSAVVKSIMPVQPQAKSPPETRPHPQPQAVIESKPAVKNEARVDSSVSEKAREIEDKARRLIESARVTTSWTEPTGPGYTVVKRTDDDGTITEFWKDHLRSEMIVKPNGERAGIEFSENGQIDSVLYEEKPKQMEFVRYFPDGHVKRIALPSGSGDLHAIQDFSEDGQLLESVLK